MFSKFGKEKKIFKNDSFRVKYGTIDAAKLDAIYIDVESWIQPTKIINFERDIRLTRNKIINKIKELIDKEFFFENVIVDLDLRSSGMALSKKSFMCVEVTVYPKAIHKFNSELLTKKIQDVANIIMNSVDNNNYKFHSKK